MYNKNDLFARRDLAGGWTYNKTDLFARRDLTGGWTYNAKYPAAGTELSAKLAAITASDYVKWKDTDEGFELTAVEWDEESPKGAVCQWLLYKGKTLLSHTEV